MLQTDSTAIAQDGTSAVHADSAALASVADSSPAFSPWLIAQQMKGCTPQQLDSAIQANLPRRERFLSNRPDTLCIPGLPGRRPYESAGRLPDFDGGFFRGSPMYHPELPSRATWRDALPVPYRPSRDDAVTVGMLLCFFILVCVAGHIRRQLTVQTREFFFEPKERTGPLDQETSIAVLSRWAVVFLLCLMGGLAAWAHVRSRFDAVFSLPFLVQMLGIYVGCFLLYFLAKRMLSGFLNWIFFPPSQRRLWRNSCSYLFTLEALLCFPLLLAAVYLGIPLERGIWVLVSVLAVGKLLLTFKALSIFFPKSYGLFHLFAYLCTLELMPLLALWKSLAFITDSLIVKY